MKRILVACVAGAMFLFMIIAGVGCGQGSTVPAPTVPQKAAGMTQFEYLACDGGPHLVLPKELSGQWNGSTSPLDANDPKSDYGRACAAHDARTFAPLINVGGGQAIVLDNPPLSAWGRSPEGWIDIYSLQSWVNTNLDALIGRAVAAEPTANMKDSGREITLTQPGLLLMFAGDTAKSSAYGVISIPIGPGTYQVLEGHYLLGKQEEVYIARLQPKTK